MAQKDWRDILGGSLTSFPEADSDTNIESESKKTQTNRQDLIVRFEKRNGKPATIISNFQGSEKDLKDLAASLKKHCNTGGSAKDDEILIQGDVRNKVAAFLKGQGHSVRGDFKK